MNNQQYNLKEIIVLFGLDEPRYALPLSSVERVVSSVEITPLPKAPNIVLGVINFQGYVIPVINIRSRFLLSKKDLTIDDQFIIVRTSKRMLALIVDSVEDVIEISQNQFVDAEEAFPFADYLKGAAKTEERIVLISDLEKFLSIEEEQKLDEALSREKQ